MTFTPQQKIVLVVIACLVLIASVAVVVKYGPSFNSERKLADLAQEEVDPTVYQDWVVYNNDSLKFSIEIPKEWIVDEERDSENAPTGNISFKPSSSAAPSRSSEIKVSLRKTKEAMTSPDEFNQYKNENFTDLVASYQKITVVSISGAESILFKSTTSNDRLELLSWMYKNQDSVFIETVNDGTDEQEAVSFHRYLLSTVTF